MEKLGLNWENYSRGCLRNLVKVRERAFDSSCACACGTWAPPRGVRAPGSECHACLGGSLCRAQWGVPFRCHTFCGEQREGFRGGKIYSRLKGGSTLLSKPVLSRWLEWGGAWAAGSFAEEIDEPCPGGRGGLWVVWKQRGSTVRSLF